MAKSLPEKVDGEHRWVILSVHVVTEEELREGRPIISSRNLFKRTIGCADCEDIWDKKVGRPCPAGDMYAGGVRKD